MRKTTKAPIVMTMAVAIGLMIASSATAVVYFEENFDSYADGSTLKGQVGPNGQTWREFDLWNGAFKDMAVNFTAGQDGTLGAGPSAGGENAVAIDIGQELSSGILQIEFDLYIGSNRQSGPQWWLKDAESGNNISLALDWMDNATGGLDPQSGFHAADSGTNPPNLLWDTEITAATLNMHGSYTVDLDNKTVRYVMTSVEEGSVADSGIVNYEEDYSPESIYLYLGAISSSNSRGYDNICIASTAEECGSTTPTIPTDMIWKSADSGDWHSGTNWSGGIPGGEATQSSHHTATFGDAIGSNARTVFLDTAVSVNSITFDHGAGSYRIAGGPGIDLIQSTVDVAPSLAVVAGSHEFQLPLGIQANTTADIADGATLTLNNALNLNGNTLTKAGTGTLTVNNVLNTGGGSLAGVAGTISGSGTVGGNLDNSGAIVAPGNSPGVLSVSGDYTQGAGGTLAIEITGTGAGEGGHDQLNVSGAAALDGTLDIQTDAGFTPGVGASAGQIGDSYVIVSAGSVSGTFATINGRHMGGGKFYLPEYNATNVTLGAFQAAAGDADGDRDVDITDFNSLANGFDPSGDNAASNNWMTADFDADGDVDITDFNGLANNFAPGGYAGEGPGQVPEPTAMVLFGIGGLFLLLRNLRRRNS